MAVLTVEVTDDRIRAVEETAVRESKTREEVIDDAIDSYMMRKAWARLQELGREMREKGITEEDVNQAFQEVRAEERQKRSEDRN